MFRLSVTGEVDGKPIRLIAGERYVIKASNDGIKKSYEGTYITFKKESLLLKTVDCGYWIDFDTIDGIIKI